jgi:cell division protein FtsL
VTAEATPGKRERKERRRSLVWLTEAQAALGWGALMVLAAVLGAIYLSQTSRIASVGRTVQDLQAQLDEVKRQNATLEREIAEAQSLDRLQEQASQMGFIQASADDVEYMVIEDYPVAAPEAAEEPAPMPLPVQSFAEALRRLLERSIGGLTRGVSP